MFHHIPPFPGDPILTLNENFASDPHPRKVNLSIGVYLDEQGKLPVMQAVAQAKADLQATPYTHPYLPMEGLREYRMQAQQMLFGGAAPQDGQTRIATVQTLGGSGALRIGGDFLKEWFPGANIWVSGPTWDNHWGIFAATGFKVSEYPYFSAQKNGIDFEAMLATLSKLPAGDVVVLHGCCHNPTGADLSEEQWRELAVLFKERGLVPFFDVAYQGFGRGIDEDAFAVRHFVEHNIPMLVASSFSKNFALYGERCGALHIVCKDGAEASTVLSQLKSTIRRNYSNPPAFGGRLVAGVLSNATLRSQWENELTAMRNRMATMRASLHQALQARTPNRDFSHIARQTGMFSFTGLDLDTVRKVRKEFGIYVLDSGRLCIAALTPNTVEYVAESIATACN